MIAFHPRSGPEQWDSVKLSPNNKDKEQDNEMPALTDVEVVPDVVNDNEKESEMPALANIEIVPDVVNVIKAETEKEKENENENEKENENENKKVDVDVHKASKETKVEENPKGVPTNKATKSTDSNSDGAFVQIELGDSDSDLSYQALFDQQQKTLFAPKRRHHDRKDDQKQRQRHHRSEKREHHHRSKNSNGTRTTEDELERFHRIASSISRKRTRGPSQKMPLVKDSPYPEEAKTNGSTYFSDYSKSVPSSIGNATVDKLTAESIKSEPAQLLMPAAMTNKPSNNGDFEEIALCEAPDFKDKNKGWNLTRFFSCLSCFNATSEKNKPITFIEERGIPPLPMVVTIKQTEV